MGRTNSWGGRQTPGWSFLGGRSRQGDKKRHALKGRGNLKRGWCFGGEKGLEMDPLLPQGWGKRKKKREPNEQTKGGKTDTSGTLALGGKETRGYN